MGAFPSVRDAGREGAVVKMRSYIGWEVDKSNIEKAPTLGKKEKAWRRGANKSTNRRTSVS
eukprot:756016-Hanusia_phi.AAC.2